MYIALPRARRKLCLSYAQSRMLHGQTRYGVPSRFFHEIPEPLMRRVNARFRSGDSGFGFRDAGFRSRDLTADYASSVTSHQSRIHASSTPLRGTSHESPVTSSPWRVGQSVTHPKFGAGVIVNAEGRGADARVQVNFKAGGLKWLMLEYAKLAPA